MKRSQYILTIFSIWLLALILISWLGFYQFRRSETASPIFLKNLANWDGGHFLGIAEFGYREEYQYAFFPTYPLAIKYLTNITENYLLSAILISFVTSLTAIFLLYKLINLDFGRKIAEKTLVYLLLFPTSFFLLAAYSEGLFLSLTLSSFYFLRKNNLFLAALFCALASATRITGLGVVISLFVYVQITQGFNRKNWYVIFLAPLGFLIYCWYLYSQTGDPFYFATAEQHWQRYLVPPGVGFWETIKSISLPGFLEKNFMSFLDLILSVFGVGLIFRSFRFLPINYSIYGLVSILIPLITPSLSSMPRFLLTIFPIFISVALIKNEYIIFGYQLISTMLLAAFTILFINGFWVG